MKKDIIIRKATKEDAEGKGYVHYKSWLETYTGHFPDEVMKNKVSLEWSVKMAREHPENTYVAITDNKIVGFSCYLESRDKDLTDTGELMAIYILKDYQKLGIGKQLLDVCLKELKNYKTISLWVLESNSKAIRFYENNNFIKDGKTKTIFNRTAIRMLRNN